jgi:hypothetical protein
VSLASADLTGVGFNGQGAQAPDPRLANLLERLDRALRQDGRLL